ncbi:hypothetical protein MSI_15040 [Treponema sp. JC4]|uniref:hypothetical protein n=1 Tax=Treponema sp. JC4 TaxID=1124982 RepID=UPI00025B0730|nr:hypothetical protein [Treponema sp. JC4]EID85017.1 hypothetical protein MSI_15040 [Treponema sp. JC4]
MKKLIGATLCLFLAFSAFAGEKFENIVGAGLTLPVSVTKYNSSSDSRGFDGKSFTQVGLGADLFWVGVMKDMGLAFKADFAIDGFLKSEYDDLEMDIAPEKPKLSSLFDKKTFGEISFDVGAGYAFIRNDKFTLAAFGVIGVTATANEYEATHDGNTAKMNFKSASFDFGADIFANYKIVKGFGVFADLAFKGMAGSTTVSVEIPEVTPGVSFENSTTTSTIGFKFAPTIGASFAF